ncbi:MAG: DUF2085 domain-containing protein [Candidatus Bilamarchaeaceae archaeon]
MRFDSKSLYFIYTALLLILETLVIITPLIAFSDKQTGEALYSAFAQTCHQKLSRSFCLFKTDGGYLIDDCTPQTGVFVPNDNTLLLVERNGLVGYKFPVCARCLALYTFALIGALAYPLLRRIEEKRLPPAIYFVIAILPLAIDGTLQFVSTTGFIQHYESTNAIRLLTGGLAGFALSFYVIPIIMALFGED